MNHDPVKPVLGLIGAIGAGKSTAAAVLARLGGRVIDCDQIGHRVLDTPKVHAELVTRWGDSVVTPTGAINRRAVGEIVFGNPVERAALEAIVFPAIRLQAEAEMAAAASDPAIWFTVLDAAVLLEAGWHDACSQIIYLDAPHPVRAARVLARSGWTQAELDRREAAQWPAETKRRYADAVVTNTGTAAALHTELARLIAGWGWGPPRPPEDARPCPN